MKRLLCFFANKLDGTSFYRGAGPFSQLEVEGWQIDFAGDCIDWPLMMKYDVLFVQRPQENVHLQSIYMAKRLGLKVWTDFDDNLFEVPMSNPGYGFYNKPGTQEIVRSCIELSDVVSVSTPALQAAFKRHTKQTSFQVIRNAWDFKHFPMKKRQPEKTILWRGSSTHQEDLLSQADEFVKIHHNFPEYKWVFFGSYPYQILERMDAKRVQLLNFTGTLEYFAVLEKINPEVVLVPLKDSEFNRAKSNIAWIEATWAGAVCIGPAMPEWEALSIVQYHHAFPMSSAFEIAISQRDSIIEAAKEAIPDLFTANEVRRDVLEALVE